jgi:CheY-like chemotaxis protein
MNHILEEITSCMSGYGWDIRPYDEAYLLRFIEKRADPALRNIPVVALTASAMKGSREEILAYGFNAYVAKPVDSEILKNTIQEVLGGS